MAGIKIIDVKEVDEKMVKEMLDFNLSEHEFPEGYFPKEKVKEFIRKLKKFHMSSDCLHLQIRPEEIDELAGDKLI